MQEGGTETVPFVYSKVIRQPGSLRSGREAPRLLDHSDQLLHPLQARLRRYISTHSGFGAASRLLVVKEPSPVMLYPPRRAQTHVMAKMTLPPGTAPVAPESWPGAGAPRPETRWPIRGKTECRAHQAKDGQAFRRSGRPPARRTEDTSEAQSTPCAAPGG